MKTLAVKPILLKCPKNFLPTISSLLFPRKRCLVLKICLYRYEENISLMETCDLYKQYFILRENKSFILFHLRPTQIKVHTDGPRPAVRKILYSEIFRFSKIGKQTTIIQKEIRLGLYLKIASRRRFPRNSRRLNKRQ